MTDHTATPGSLPLHASRKVAVVGTGYVGTVTASCLAWLGHEVIGLEVDPKRVGQLQAGQAPFYEPGLPELLTQSLATERLRFTDSPEVALKGADIVFLCVGTPIGPGGLPDLRQVEAASESLASCLRDGLVVVNKSTVPVGSGNWVKTLLEESLPPGGATKFSVVSNPEFLREGSAISDFLYPDRIVLGGEKGAVDTVTQLYLPILRQDFPGGRVSGKPQLILTDLPSAEMIKYAANAFLATKISFANEIASMCELFGADAGQVLPAIGADERIGPLFLSPGIGWGGSCFGKDLAALIAMASEYGYNASMLRATVDVNRAQPSAVLRKLQGVLKVLKGRRITMLGLAFKPGTDDLRDAPALAIATRLLNLGASVSAYDPVVKQLPPELAKVRLRSDPYDAAERADAVLLATDWPEFRSLDFAQLSKAMTGTVIVDGRNILDTEAASAAGLTVLATGR